MNGQREMRYRIARRATQVGVLGLLWLGAHAHLGLLTGDLSSSRILRTIPLADPFAVLQILVSGQTLASTVLVGAAIVLVFYALVGGRSFCAWVCPVNPVADLAAWIQRRGGVRAPLRLGSGVRYGVLALTLALSAILGVAAFEWVSPIGMIHRELVYGAGFGLLAAVWILGLDLFVLRRGWCGSLCPLGAFYALVGQLSVLRVSFGPDRCDRCGECTPVCPEPQVLRFEELASRGWVTSGECSNCGRCVEVCPRDALRFGLRLRRG